MARCVRVSSELSLLSVTCQALSAPLFSPLCKLPQQSFGLEAGREEEEEEEEGEEEDASQLQGE